MLEPSSTFEDVNPICAATPIPVAFLPVSHDEIRIQLCLDIHQDLSLNVKFGRNADG